MFYLFIFFFVVFLNFYLFIYEEEVSDKHLCNCVLVIRK